ncbi:MAG TPA: nuclear transport factor 2 family protein [Thermoanaerobaculia bacterium]|jgi:ketosteroid isomerase-like protein
MKTTAALVLLLFGSLAFAQTNPPPAREETAVRDAEAKWVEALDRRDGAALRALLDEDFLDVTWKGEVRDRQAAVAALSAPGRPEMTPALQDLRVRFAVPDVAIVTGVNAVSSKSPAFAARIRFTDVFVKRGSAWKALSAQETLEAGSGSGPS